MKNKALTYFLFIMVAVVWGVIIYRIFDASSSDDTIHTPGLSNVFKKPTLESYNESKDTTTLRLNYPDPFSTALEPDLKQIPINKLVGIRTISKPLPPPAINWSFITYSGYIKNARQKHAVTIITINGNTFNLSEGETAANVKLLKNMRDSIKVSYNGVTKNIAMITK